MMQATAELDSIFSALADPTRRAMLAQLANGEASVSELAAPFEMSQPAISKHIKVLEKAGLIVKTRDGQRRPCRLQVDTLVAAEDWIERYRRVWETNFARLDTLLDELKAGSSRGKDEQ